MLWVCKFMKVYKHNNLCITIFLLLVSLHCCYSSNSRILPWDSPQQNDAFLKLLLQIMPQSVSIFSEYDAGKVPDALGSTFEIQVADGEIITEPGGDFNAVNPVQSLYGDVGTVWVVPVTSFPFTTCWLARHDEDGNSDWNSICSTSYGGGFHVRDQQYGDGMMPMIHTKNANWVHSRYHWDQALGQNNMKIVTRALRKEIGGIPYADTAAVVHISDPRAYNLRLLIALRPPQSINIFADLSGKKVPDRIGHFPVDVENGSKHYDKKSNKWISNTIAYMGGDYTTKVLWPKDSVPATMTMCSVSRLMLRYGIYYYQANFKMLSCMGSPDQPYDYVHGHFYNRRGIVYSANGFNTNADSRGIDYEWLVMCVNTGSSVPGNVIIDQTSIGTTKIDHESCRLNVNYDDTSAFHLHSVYIWNAELSNTEMKVVTAALRAQIGGVPDGDNTVAVDPMPPSPTAYEHMCWAGTRNDDNTGDCICEPGYSHIVDGVPCVECEAGTFKDKIGAVECTMCPYHKSSARGSIQESDCRCMEGYYSTGDGGCNSCPTGTSSLFNATSIENCLCIPGWFLNETECVPCPESTHNNELGNGDRGTCIPCF